MTERIVERIGSKEITASLKPWYGAKVNELALFLVERIKKDSGFLERIESSECEKSEVLTK